MRKWGVVLLSAITCWGLVINGAHAAGNEEGLTLGTIVVTGTRIGQRIERVPANVTVIDEEEIKHSNAKTVVDLLRCEEGIVVRDLIGNGKRSQVDLRGFGETGQYNTLLLVDGRRVNEIDLSGVDWTQIPLNQIERIEVVRGAGTVLYGDNAAGGVINIITKLPSKELSFSAGTMAGSYDRNKEEISFSGGRENIAASFFGSYDSTNGYRDNGEFRAADVGGKIVFDPTEIFSLNLAGSYHRDDFGLPGALTEEVAARHPTRTIHPDDEGETTDAFLKLGFDMDLGRYGGIVTDFSYRDRESDSKFVSEYGTFLQDSEADTWAVTPRYVWNGELLHHTNTLIAGVDLYWSEKETFSGPPAAPSGRANVKKDSLGGYFNNEFSVLESLILSVGARRERVKYDLTQEDLTDSLPPLDDTVTERENAYSAGLTFLYSGKSSIFVRANRSLRFPLTDELIETDQSTYEIRVNSNLKPQRGRHYEAGVRHYITPDVQGSVTLFRADIKDEIFLDPTPAPFFGTNVNHPETLHQGIEIGAKADLFKKVTVFGNCTYEKATFEKEPFKGEDVPAVPRYKANLGFRIYDVVPGLVFSANFNYVGSSFLISDQANQFEKLEHYHTIDARLSYEWRQLKAFIAVNNLTDEGYSEYAVIGATGRNLYPAPERNWLAGLEIAF